MEKYSFPSHFVPVHHLVNSVPLKGSQYSVPLGLLCYIVGFIHRLKSVGYTAAHYSVYNKLEPKESFAQ